MMCQSSKNQRDELMFGSVGDESQPPKPLIGNVGDSMMQDSLARAGPEHNTFDARN